MKLVFVRNNQIFGRLIRWATRSEWDHVAIWDDETLECWEAVGSRGVLHHFDWWPSPKDMQVCTIEAEGLNELRPRIREFLNSQVGKGYDWLAITRFLTRRMRPYDASEKRWFCSELAAAAFAVVGIDLLRRRSTFPPPCSMPLRCCGSGR